MTYREEVGAFRVDRAAFLCAILGNAFQFLLDGLG